MVKIRIANIKDAHNLASIDKLWKKEGISRGFVPRTKQQFTKAIKNEIVVVAEEENVLCGYALGTIKAQVKTHTKINKKYVDLDSLFVLKEYRSNGIGTMLMKKLLNEVKLRNIKRIELAADNKENPEGLNKFYKKFGFRTTIAYFEKEIEIL